MMKTNGGASTSAMCDATPLGIGASVIIDNAAVTISTDESMT
jgi:hypothetical protein